MIIGDGVGVDVEMRKSKLKMGNFWFLESKSS